MPVPPRILQKQDTCEKLFFYQKTVVLYDMTYVFCKRFLSARGDRTVDQMIQAARSGKQNIVEGCADGVTSAEMQINLLNVARASIKELKEDYADYVSSRKLKRWNREHPRYAGLLAFCRKHNQVEDYEQFFEKWNAEEFANCAITLCHMVDRMMATHLAKKANDFIEHGGIRERMTTARTNRRKAQVNEISSLAKENELLKTRLALLEHDVAELKKIVKSREFEI